MNLLEKIRNFLHWETSPKPHIIFDNELYFQSLQFKIHPVLIQMSMFIGFGILKELVNKRDKSKELKFV